MTQTSKSKTRRVAAIGNGCVIPAKAGIHVATVNSQWIPAFAGMTAKKSAVAHPSKSKTRSVAAIGNGCVISAYLGNFAGIHVTTVTEQWIPACLSDSAGIDHQVAP